MKGNSQQELLHEKHDHFTKGPEEILEGNSLFLGGVGGKTEDDRAEEDTYIKRGKIGQLELTLKTNNI